MRKMIIGFAICSFMACTKEQNPIPEETKVNNAITFQIVPAADYSQSQYDGATAQFKLYVYKLHKTLNTTEIILGHCYC